MYFDSDKINDIDSLLFTLEAQTHKEIYDFLTELKKETYIQFIRLAYNRGYSKKEISVWIDKPAEFVHSLYRYGSKGRTTPSGRKKILERDNFTCQVCGANEKLHIHHIGDPTSRDKDNLIALCARCHMAEHKKVNEKIKVSA